VLNRYKATLPTQIKLEHGISDGEGFIKYRPAIYEKLLGENAFANDD